MTEVRDSLTVTLDDHHEGPGGGAGAEHGGSGRVVREKRAEPKGCLRKSHEDREGSFRWPPGVA